MARVSGWIAGVDGCREGWIMARQALNSPQCIDIAIHRSFATILDVADPPMIVAVDMPIGLPEKIGEGGRGPEKIVRSFLGRRKSSVFSVPSRSAVYSECYLVACLRASVTSDPPRKISRQAFMLFPKIREIDHLLRDHSGNVDPPWRKRVFEVHPEFAFCRLNYENPLSYAKKARKGSEWPGRSERIAILRSAGIPEDALGRRPPPGAAMDDMLDALVALCVARRIREGSARCFPERFAYDAFGLPIAIWA